MWTPLLGQHFINTNKIYPSVNLKRYSMKPVFCVLVFLSLPSILLTAQDEIPKDYKAPYSEPPKLELKFKDDFQQDSRGDYQISGKKDAVTWEKGKLTLGEGAILKRELNAGSWVEMELDLEFPELTEDGQTSELKVWLDLEDTTDSFVSFRQIRANGATRSSISILDTEGNWQDESGQQPVSTPVEVAGPPGLGRWAIRYRNGLWTVENTSKEIRLFAYMENEAAKVKQLLCVASENSIELRSVRLQQAARIEINYPAAVAKQIASAEELAAKYMSLYKDGKIAQAIPLARSFADLVLRLKGTYDPDYASSLNNLAVLYESLSDYTKAEPLFLEAKTILEKVLGKEHPDYATSLNNLAYFYHSLGEYAKAEPLYLEAKTIDAKVLGKEHPSHAGSLSNLAGLYELKGEYAKAEPLYLEAKTILEKVLGKEHPDYATSLNNLANLYSLLGDYAKAEPLFLEATTILGKVLGMEHPDYATSLNNLAGLYYFLGDYAKAEPLFLEAKTIREKVLGKEHSSYAISLNDLAALYESLGEYAKAEPLYLEARTIDEKVLGKEHPNYATSLNNLAYLYGTLGDYIKAEPLYLEAKTIREKVFGKEHPSYATSLNNLAGLYELRGDYAKAKPLYLEAKTIREQVLGKQHPDYASGLINLAGLYQSLGDYAKAEPLFLEAKTIDEKVLGKEHPDYASGLGNLASLYESLGEYAKAEPLLSKSLQITHKNFDRYSTIQSEKQRKSFAKSFEWRLSSFMSNALKLDERGKSVWEPAVRWKGMSLVRQKQNLVLAKLPETSETFAELKSIRAQMSKHLQGDPTTENWKKRTKQLENEEERLEKKLAQVAKDLGLQQSVDFDSKIQLPAGACLVDFRRFTYSEPDPDKPGKFFTEPHYLALIRQSDNSVEMIDLGSAEEIERAITEWRSPIERANRNRRAIDVREQIEMDRAGQLLRKLLWEPLEKHIGETELVIVSPDGALGRLPLIALPGKQPGTYLLEEKKIVYLPVPALLPQMLAKPAKPINPSTRALLVGGIDYGKASKEAIPDRLSQRNLRILQQLKFPPLKSSGIETEVIKSLFEQATQLTGVEATEKELQQKLTDHSVLHIATHGFFQSPDRFMKRIPPGNQQSFVALREQAKVLTENPNLLSGLALANANSAASKKIDEGDNDGILYSAEIALLPMEHVELAVLSACETSLGTDDNPGEGLIGIQRAFQVAGAKSTIASFWKIDDRATQMLMNRFYQNLIAAGRKAKTTGQDPNSTTVRIDALIEAQRWMLRDMNPQEIAQLQLRDLEDEDGVPNKKPKKSDSAKPNKNAAQSVSPRYWAAFVLSGDWR